MLRASETLVVRQAKARDLPGVAGLLGALTALGRDGAVDVTKHKIGLKALLDRPDRALVLVAESGNCRLIGLCTLQILVSASEGGDIGVLEDFVVAADYRGRGVGRRMLHEAEHWAANRNLRRLQLLVGQNNTSAVNFYRDHGWVETGHIDLRRYP